MRIARNILIASIVIAFTSGLIQIIQQSYDSSTLFVALSKEFGGPAKTTTLSTGTGFFVAESGYLVTADHVVQDCTSIKVRDAHGRVSAAHLVARDGRPDLAILALSRANDRDRRALDPYLDFTDAAHVGKALMAVGYAGPTDDLQFSSVGTVIPNGHPGVDIGLVWFHALHVQQGFSGGPLIDANTGRVIGITQRYADNLPDKLVLGRNLHDGFGIDAVMYADFLDRNHVTIPPSQTPPTSDPKSAVVRIVCFTP